MLQDHNLGIKHMAHVTRTAGVTEDKAGRDVLQRERGECKSSCLHVSMGPQLRPPCPKLEEGRLISVYLFFYSLEFEFDVVSGVCRWYLFLHSDHRENLN